MTETKTQSVTAIAKSVVHTYPASTLAAKYGLDVALVRKLKMGGKLDIPVVPARAMEVDKIIAIINPKETKE